MTEIWKKLYLKNFNSIYDVSNKGVVRNMNTYKILNMQQIYYQLYIINQSENSIMMKNR